MERVLADKHPDSASLLGAKIGLTSHETRGEDATPTL
jgi:hypothetical protein